MDAFHDSPRYPYMFHFLTHNHNLSIIDIPLRAQALDQSSRHHGLTMFSQLRSHCLAHIASLLNEPHQSTIIDVCYRELAPAAKSHLL